MDNQLRTFTAEEANALLPTLRQLIRVLQTAHQQAIDLETQIDAEELISEKGSEKSAHAINQLMENHRQRVTEFYAIVEQIHSYGCILKDIEMGLIDFYAVINGNVVFLCWKMGEEKVNHWHEVGQGYTARQSLA